ncbi:MAG: FGLLP motif-containing membrane protein [Acidimicrobiales bacterium]
MSGDNRARRQAEWGSTGKHRAVVLLAVVGAGLILALTPGSASAQATSFLTGTAEGNVVSGAPVTDSAALEANQPTGTITFVLYGPNDSSCTNPVFTSVVPVNGGGVYTSTSFQVGAVGTYSWVASYSGDDANDPATTACGVPGEVFTVSQASDALTAASTVNGATLTDTATLSAVAPPPPTAPPTTVGAAALPAHTTAAALPTGNLFFSLFGPGDPSCASGAVFRSGIGVNGFGAYPSFPGYTATAGGVYRWDVSYSGDADYASATLTCVDATTVTLAPPPTTVPSSPTTSAPANSTTTTAPAPRTTTTPPTTAPRTATTVRKGVAPATTTPTTLHRTTAPAGPPTSRPPTSPPGASPPPSSPPTVPGGAPTFSALTPSNQTVGPPGGGLNVAISDLPARCNTAYFFFDATRIGSAPVHGRSASEGGISIPGDAPAGYQTLTVSCDSSDQHVVAATTYHVKTGSIGRNEILTSLNEPREVAVTAKSFGISAAVAAGGIALVAFPAQIFNATLIEHYEEVRRWFGLRRPLSEVVTLAGQRILLPVFVIGGGVLFALLTPGFAFNLSTLALVLGLSIAVAVTTFGLALPTFIYFGVKRRERGRILVMPGTLLLGAAFVLVSRLINFQPGYLYGVLAIFLFRSELDRRRQGVLAAVSAVLVLLSAFLLWWVRVPLAGSDMANPSFWSVVLESALGGAFIMGVESTVVAMLPLRFLDGERIKAWSRVAWLVLFLLATTTFVQVLIQPGTGYVGRISTGSEVFVGALYVGFAVLSVAFWAYFRFRETPEEEAHPEEDELEREGELEVR